MYSPPAYPPDDTTPRARKHPFTLAELAVACLIVWGVGALLYRSLDTPHLKLQKMVCLSHEKQILFAMMMYAQDYDERQVPVASIISTPDGIASIAFWAGNNPPKARNSHRPTTRGLIDPYLFHLKDDPSLLTCPSVPDTGDPPTYMLNDLAAGVKTRDIASPSITVLLVDGDATHPNFGHSRAFDIAIARHAGAIARIGDPQIQFTPGEVTNAALARHEGGVIGYVDGHARALHSEEVERVFFPPYFQHSRTHLDLITHRPIGPDPTGAMTYNGNTYHATLQIR